MISLNITNRESRVESCKFHVRILGQDEIIVD